MNQECVINTMTYTKWLVECSGISPSQYADFALAILCFAIGVFTAKSAIKT